MTERYYSGCHDKRGEVGHYHDGTEHSQLELSEWYVPSPCPRDMVRHSISRNVTKLEQILFHDRIR